MHSFDVFYIHTHTYTYRHRKNAFRSMSNFHSFTPMKLRKTSICNPQWEGMFIWRLPRSRRKKVLYLLLFALK